jgi:pSer/pThr/pTyr-binding forkhead associated (FHA) protein
MPITLTVTAGPHQGRVFTFAERDSFLVGRSKYAHFQLGGQDSGFSRLHFLIDLDARRCRLVDLNSRNGTYVNGRKATALDLNDGDEICVAHTVLRVALRVGEPACPTPADGTRMDADSPGPGPS